jgi:FKBP-type peptidyl-prolyl cis-trans isomerase FklB
MNFSRIISGLFVASFVLAVPVAAQSGKDDKKAKIKPAKVEEAKPVVNQDVRPAPPAPIERPTFKTFEDSVSYVIGLNIGKDINKTGVKFNIDLVAQGMKDSGNPNGLLSEDACNGTMMKFQQMMQAKQQAEQSKQNAGKQEAAAKNLAAANAFLAENKKKPGVIETASGLQYEKIKAAAADAKSPTLENKVTVHYEGKLINGKVFDSSYARNEPATFPLNGLIEAWKEGIQLMKKGDTFMLYVPPKMGYGEAGAGADIGPNEVLIFKVELIDFQ